METPIDFYRHFSWLKKVSAEASSDYFMSLGAYYGPIIKSVPWGSFLHFLACLWEKREALWLCDNYSSDRDAFLFVFVLLIVDVFF